jgi:hypothetical protein
MMSPDALVPKGTDLSVRRRDALNAIASQSNRHPPKRFDFKCPLKVMGEVMQDVTAMQHNAPTPSNDRIALSPCIRPAYQR